MKRIIFNPTKRTPLFPLLMSASELCIQPRQEKYFFYQPTWGECGRIWPFVSVSSLYQFCNDLQNEKAVDGAQKKMPRMLCIAPAVHFV